MLAIRSRRYTTVGPVQSAVCNFGQVVGSPCLPVTVCAHGGLGLRYTEVRKPWGTPLFTRKPRVHAWKHPMDRRARVANPLRQRAFGFELVHDFSVCFVSSVLFAIHVFTFNAAIELRTYSRCKYRNSHTSKKDLVSKYFILLLAFFLFIII